MSEPFFLTVREAAFVAGVSLSEARDRLDEVAPLLEKFEPSRGEASARRLSRPHVFFLAATAGRDHRVPREWRRDFLLALLAADGQQGRPDVRLSHFFFFDYAGAEESVVKKLNELDAIHEFVTEGPNQQPWIKGTQFDVYRVAALASTSVEEARLDYPDLSIEQVARASLYASIYPKQGSPYPTTASKRLLLEANIEGLDEALAALRNGVPKARSTRKGRAA